jgi:hypothetical protein
VQLRQEQVVRGSLPRSVHPVAFARAGAKTQSFCGLARAHGRTFHFDGSVLSGGREGGGRNFMD